VSISIRRAPAPHRVLALAAVLAALVAMAVAALSGATAQAAKPPFKVLFIVPQSGPFAFAGKAEVAGLNAGIKSVNATGGIDGRRVTYKAVDDAGSGAKAAAAAVDELSKDKYDMVICGMSGADAPPCSAAIAQRKMLQMAVAAEDVLGDPKQSPNTYVTLNRFDSNAAAVVLRLKKDRKSKVAILAGDNASGRAGATAMQNAFKKAKITTTDTVYVPTGATDATPQVQKAQSSGAQAIVIPAFNLQNVAIMKARTKLGWNVPAYLDPFAGSFNYASVLTPEERTNAFSAAFPFQIKGTKASKTRAAKVFFKNVAVYDPKPVLAINAHNVAYNTVILAQAAAKKAKGSTAAKLLNGMKKVKVTAKDAPLAVGPKTLYTNPRVHAPQVKGSEYQWFKLGSIVDGIQVPA
jgi:branched-chain amino acid transport system substrate-binding protein